MSPGWASLLASVPCVGCEGAAGGGLGFYQVAASVLAVLLLTGVAGEIRALRDGNDDDGPGAEISVKYSIAIAVVLFALLCGEIFSLVVLVTEHPSDFARIAVSACLLLSLFGVPGLMVWAMWEERLRALRRRLLAVFALMPVALIGVGAYFLVASITHSPDRHTYRVYGTCASGRNHCGLNERIAPDSAAKRLGQLRDGEEVEIVCQTIGTEVANPRGGSSIVWDRLDNGNYVTDVYVDTPPAGSEINICPDQEEGDDPRG